jgi:hypothetical protein
MSTQQTTAPAAQVPDLTHDQWDAWQDKHGLILEREALDDLRAMLAAAPVQVLQRYSPDGEGGMEVDSLGAYVKHQDATTPPEAQPAPDPQCERCDDVIVASNAGVCANCLPAYAARPAEPLTPDQTVPMYRAAWAAYNDPRIHNLADQIKNVVRVVIHGVEAAHNITKESES